MRETQVLTESEYGKLIPRPEKISNQLPLRTRFVKLQEESGRGLEGTEPRRGAELASLVAHFGKAGLAKWHMVNLDLVLPEFKPEAVRDFWASYGRSAKAEASLAELLGISRTEIDSEQAREIARLKRRTGVLQQALAEHRVRAKNARESRRVMKVLGDDLSIGYEELIEKIGPAAAIRGAAYMHAAGWVTLGSRELKLNPMYSLEVTATP